ncbi:MAG TPA: phosphotransferase [Thermomicrobiaceae bacterium]|nr:phosphotransferase [Thermomicrobiaceae bacterium]
MLASEQARLILREAFPDLAINTVEYLGAGWDSRGLLVNGETVFRFPMRADAGERLLREARLLGRIGGRLPLQVPIVTDISKPTASYPFPIVGHRLVPGPALDDPTMRAIPDEVVANGLIPFLLALHAVPLDAVHDLGLLSYTPESWRTWHRELFEQALPVVEERLSRETFDRFRRLWEEHFGDQGCWAFTPGLIHGDLSAEHIMVEPDPWHVIGVIDFGDARIGDPVLDYAGLSDQVARTIIAAIHDPRDSTVWQRRELYRDAVPLHHIDGGLFLGRDDLVDAGLSRIEHRFRAS